MSLTELIGYAAGVLTTLYWYPQVRKALYERDTKALSLPAFLVLAIGLGCWLTYGLALGEWPLIVANATSLTLVLAVIVAKLRYG